MNLMKQIKQLQNTNINELIKQGSQDIQELKDRINKLEEKIEKLNSKRE